MTEIKNIIKIRFFLQAYTYKMKHKSAKTVENFTSYNAFKARLDKFWQHRGPWQHQSVKSDFTADLTGTGNR